MKKFFLLLSITALASCETAPEKETTAEPVPCPVSWEDYKPTEEELAFNLEYGILENELNDSTTQEILYGKVWFEIINWEELEDGSQRCYIKNYRTDGTLESEGSASFYEHPVADYSMEGNWKFYDCDGTLKEEVAFKNGKRLK